MINPRRSSRLRKRKYNRGELGEKEKTKEKKEPGNESEEGRTKSKKKKKKKSRIWRIWKWRTKVTDEPKLEADACRRNKIEEEEEQDQETKDGGEDAITN